jgi:hypothetical protein
MSPLLVVAAVAVADIQLVRIKAAVVVAEQALEETSTNLTTLLFQSAPTQSLLVVTELLELSEVHLEAMGATVQHLAPLVTPQVAEVVAEVDQLLPLVMQETLPLLA